MLGGALVTKRHARIGVHFQSVDAAPFRKRIRVDMLIFSGNQKIVISDAVNIFHPRMIIIDATNSGFRARKWKDDALKSGVQCHAVTIDGAFEKEF